MTDALQFEVKKDKWEQLQNGSYKLTVTMNPTDLTDNNDALLMDFIKCAPGSRFVLAAVRIEDDEQPVQPKERQKCPDGLTPDGPICPKCGKPRGPSGIDGGTWVHIKTPFKDLPRTQQAAMLCKKPAFQKWLGLDLDICAQKGLDPEDIAKLNVYAHCGIQSLSELNTLPTAGELWDEYNAQFEADTRLPEQR